MKITKNQKILGAIVILGLLAWWFFSSKSSYSGRHNYRANLANPSGEVLGTKKTPMGGQ